MNEDILIVAAVMAIPLLLGVVGWYAFAPPKRFEDAPEATEEGPKETKLVECPFGCGKKIVDGTQDYHRRRCMGPKRTQRNYRWRGGGWKERS